MGFEHITWLFTNDHRNRGICRLDFDEAALLYRMVQQTDGPLLEIGRRHAGSTVLLAEASGGGEGTRRVVSIDIKPAHHPEADRYLREARLSKRLDLRTGDSRKELPAEETFGFAFIDGDHSYEGVRADVRAHWNHLKTHGGRPPIVVFHDAMPNDGLAHVPGKLAHAPGVLRLCAELVAAGVGVPIGEAASMLALVKCAELPEELPAHVDPERVLRDAAARNNH